MNIYDLFQKEKVSLGLAEREGKKKGREKKKRGGEEERPSFRCRKNFEQNFLNGLGILAEIWQWRLVFFVEPYYSFG